MNYSKALLLSVTAQHIQLELSEIPFNIFLKNCGDILTLCFLEYELDDCLIVVETTEKGTEEMKIIPKDNIEYVSIFYDFDIIEEESEDKMFL